ncbi:MAG: YciI family protein, partial [Devosia sp.]
MRVVVFVKATVDSEAEIMPGSQLLEEMGRYNEQLVDAGIMLGGDGLKPSKYGKRIVFNGVGRSVVDGPFA